MHTDAPQANPVEPLVLTGYHDVLEVFRTPSLGTFIHDGTEAYRLGTLLRIEGDAHLHRRRTMSQLFRGDGDTWFRERVLFPAIRHHIEAVLVGAGSDGVAEVDLAEMALLAFYQLQAEVIGLHQVSSREAAQEFRSFMEPIRLAMAIEDLVEVDRKRIASEGLARKEEFHSRYWAPAVADHEAFLDRIESGELPASELHHDLITMILTGKDHAWTQDSELGMREALTDMLNAGVRSTAAALVQAAHDLLQWFRAHPEDRALNTDSTFVSAAINESLRLTPFPSFHRIALEDLTLKSGTTIEKGRRVTVLLPPANRDQSVFGEDADLFNPRRQLPPGVYPYGLAFGSGRHMCYGFPLVMGSDGTSGALAQMLVAMFEAGLEAHPTKEPELLDDRYRRVWSKYPALMHRNNAAPQTDV